MASYSTVLLLLVTSLWAEGLNQVNTDSNNNDTLPNIILPHPDWYCPKITSKPKSSSSFSCSCDFPHTLRCDGFLDHSHPRPPLNRITNILKKLPNDSFVSLLDLSLQNLTSLPPKLFSGLGLSGLVISTGRLSKVPGKAFVGLEQSLTALALPNNRLKEVPAQSLMILDILEQLDLSSNTINAVNSLPSLTSLEHLDMSRNYITDIAAGVFQTLPNLKELLLSENSLQSSKISHYNLQHLSYMEKLSLASNNLTGTIKVPFFDLFPPNLKNLDLSFNQISGIEMNTFLQLPSLRNLNLQGNQIEQVNDEAFCGLVNLEILDLSHNNILTLSDESFKDLDNLVVLSLSHNFLQVLSNDWIKNVPNLRSLYLIDNDITLVETGALDNLDLLEELNFTGNPLDCDCHLTYFQQWLSNSSHLHQASRDSAQCTTPPQHTNAPLRSLPDLSCSYNQSDYGEYYEYHENSDDHMVMSSAELQIAGITYHAPTHSLVLTWRVEEAALPYKCGQLHLFEELSSGSTPVHIAQNSLICSSYTEDTPETLTVTLDAVQYGLHPLRAYHICISLIETKNPDRKALIPGCTEPFSIDPSGEAPSNDSIQMIVPDVRIHKLETQAIISAFHANMSDASTVGVFYRTIVPRTALQGCRLHVSVSPPGDKSLQVRTLDCAANKYVFTNLTPHAQFNVCAVMQVEQSNLDKEEVEDLLEHGGECVVAHVPRIRYESKSVMPLLLTLVFLALGIACLTVLYLIVKHYREDTKHSAFLDAPMVPPLMGFCWKLQRKKGQPAFFLDNMEEEHINVDNTVI